MCLYCTYVGEGVSCISDLAFANAIFDAWKMEIVIHAPSAEV